VYVNQGAASGDMGFDPTDPNTGPAVNGRIQNLAGGYLGGWICPVHMTASLAPSDDGRFFKAIRRHARRVGHSGP
jgi:hypothetical protein